MNRMLAGPTLARYRAWYLTRDEETSMGESNPPVSTGRGDDGTTTLLGSGRMGKNDPRIIVLGDVDEASSFLGLARAEAEGDVGALLLGLQRLLYRIMGDVAMLQEANAVGEKDVAFVDGALEEWRGKTEIPKEFVVPGGSRLGALLDVSRTVVRRAEHGRCGVCDRAPLRPAGSQPDLGPALRRGPRRRREKDPLEGLSGSYRQSRLRYRRQRPILGGGPQWRLTSASSSRRGGGWT
jgi:cob(I)alamin adenosyltransferase